MSAVLPESAALPVFATAAAVQPHSTLSDLPAYDAQACSDLMRGGSKTFFAASLMLPSRVRKPACALYAFCRLADDEIDLGGDATQAVHSLHLRLDALYAGRPQAIDADRALASVVHHHAIPRALLDALLEGFLWDAIGRSYETLDEVQDYGARVAGTVGAMMALVMGVRDEAALARACDLGVAMQLTNIARDVGEDARNGRLYLPRQWLREAGIDPQAWLAAPSFSPAIAGVIQRLLDAADNLYRRAEHGIAGLPRDCRPAIHAARLVYAEIGRQIERNGLDAISRRAVVSGRRKLALIARAAGAVVLAPAAAKAPLTVLPAVQFLVDAAATSQACHGVAPRSFDERVGWVIQLCERQSLQQRTLR
jgi:phytoene synthase